MTMAWHAHHCGASPLAHETDGMDQLCQGLDVKGGVFWVQPDEVKPEGCDGADLLGTGFRVNGDHNGERSGVSCIRIGRSGEEEIGGPVEGGNDG